MNNVETVKDTLTTYAKMVEKALEEYLPSESCLQQSVITAMKYSMSSGGKRLRPALTLEFARLCGAKPETVMPLACAVEMVHCYSLIHDDLPCMDDDDMRRGKPACHIAFDEATALLAGDALLTQAFETIAFKCDPQQIPLENILRCIKVLSRAAGTQGMVGGQTLDIGLRDKSVSAGMLDTMYSMKTGALITASVKLGCIGAGADNEKVEAANKYAKKIGLAFQIVDDILDVTGDAKTLGKPTGSDKENNHQTYVDIYGLDKSRSIVKKLTNEAKAALSCFEESAFLCDLADYLAEREH